MSNEINLNKGKKCDRGSTLCFLISGYSPGDLHSSKETPATLKRRHRFAPSFFPPLGMQDSNSFPGNGRLVGFDLSLQETQLNSTRQFFFHFVGSFICGSALERLALWEYGS